MMRVVSRSNAAKRSLSKSKDWEEPSGSCKVEVIFTLAKAVSKFFHPQQFLWKCRLDHNRLFKTHQGLHNLWPYRLQCWTSGWSLHFQPVFSWASSPSTFSTLSDLPPCSFLINPGSLLLFRIAFALVVCFSRNDAPRLLPNSLHVVHTYTTNRCRAWDCQIEPKDPKNHSDYTVTGGKKSLLNYN